MKTVKYIRVSSKDQNTARQENTTMKLYIDKCSGTIPFKERKAGKKLLKNIDEINNIHVHSIDRLGRNAIDIQNTINDFTSKGINVIVEDLGITSLLPNGDQNPVFKLITDLMANIAQMERDNIKKRQTEGIAIAKAKGVYNKSKNRQKLTDIELLEKNKEIVTCLLNGMSLEVTKATIKRSIPTIIKVKKALKATKQL